MKPDSAEAHSHLASVYLALNRKGDAAASLKGATELRPNDGRAALGLGVVYYQWGKYDEAIPSLKRALQLEPALAEPHYWLALSLYARGQKAAARGHYNVLKTPRPDRAQKLSQLFK